jgi:hypothetical protein
VNKLEADKADVERRLREAEEEGEARIQAVKAQVQTQTGQAARYVGLSGSPRFVEISNLGR